MNAMGASEDERVLGSLVCPKPRRFDAFYPSTYEQIGPSRQQTNFNRNLDIGGSSTEAEILNVILAKGNHSDEAASPPRLYNGSPPSRAPNLVVEDANFGLQWFPPPSSPCMAAGGCVNVKFSKKQVTVRVEGFLVA